MPAGAQTVVSGGLTLSSLVGAVLVGTGGARWLTNEADKNLLRNAASKAAASLPSPDAAAKMSIGSAARIVEIANDLKTPESAAR